MQRQVYEWILFTLIIGVFIYTMFKIKNDKINFDGHWLIIFQTFKVFIPDEWQAIKNVDINKLSFKSKEHNDWEANFIWRENSDDESGIVELFQKNILARKIVFDEQLQLALNPYEFNRSMIIQSGRFEIVRLEGAATVDRENRHYCDVVLFYEKATGAHLYAESKGAILNGFLEALSFETAVISLKTI